MKSNWEKIKNESIMGTSFGKEESKTASSYEASMEALVKASFTVRTKPSYRFFEMDKSSDAQINEPKKTCPSSLQKYLRKRSGQEAAYSFYHTIRYCFKNKFSLDGHLFIDLLESVSKNPFELKWLSVLMTQSQQELIYKEVDWMKLQYLNIHDSGLAYKADLLWRSYQRKLWLLLKNGSKEEALHLLNSFYEEMGQLEEMPQRLEQVYNFWQKSLVEESGILKVFNQLVERLIDDRSLNEIDRLMLESVHFYSLIDIVGEKRIFDFWDEQLILDAFVANVSKNSDAEGALWILRHSIHNEVFKLLSTEQIKRLLFPLSEAVFEQFFSVLVKDEKIVNSGRCLTVYLHSWQYISYGLNKKVLEMYVRDCSWEEMERMLQRWVYALKVEDLDKARDFFEDFIFRSPLRFADSSETAYLDERINFNKVAKRYGHII